MNANIKPLVASLTFSSSPFENIYLKPEITTDITTSRTEKEIAKSNRFLTKSVKSV
jgi:hypothetical protein